MPFPLPHIMGIVNVTPDSFSDGGQYYSPESAVAHGLKLLRDGADILDIGGESTRPGAEDIGEEEEIRRVIPVIRDLRNHTAHISIDSYRPRTIAAALEAGASMINDITALTNLESMRIAADANVPVCLMHMQGTPRTMQDNPVYQDVVNDVLAYLIDRIEACMKAGIKKENLIIDPGIGFGKTRDHHLALLASLERVHEPGVPVLLGASRKSFIAKLDPGASAGNRLPGSLAAALRGMDAGVSILRVHDVAETRQALQVWKAMKVPEAG